MTSLGNAVQVNSLGVTLSVCLHPPEEQVAYLYLRFLSQGTLDIMWPNDRPTLSWVLNWAATSDVMAAYVTNSEGNSEIVGLVWCHPIKRVSEKLIGEVGVAFLRKIETKVTAEFGELGLDYLFGKRGLDAVYGTIPVDHRASVAFARKMGMDVYGYAPYFASWKGKATTAAMLVLTKEMWFRSANTSKEVT